jgi:hypothetical protein
MLGNSHRIEADVFAEPDVWDACLARSAQQPLGTYGQHLGSRFGGEQAYLSYLRHRVVPSAGAGRVACNFCALAQRAVEHVPR